MVALSLPSSPLTPQRPKQSFLFEESFSNTNNLFPEWVQCCNAILSQSSSFVEDNCDDDDEDEEIPPPVPIINMLPSLPPSSQNKDPWHENAKRLSQSITQMSELLHREAFQHSRAFVILSPSTTRDFSTLESTVASFAAGTANQIEQLRQSTSSFGDRSQLSDHRDGIVSILVWRLKKDVVEVMQDIHRGRMRMAMKEVWDQPFSCRWADEGKKEDGLLESLEEESDLLNSFEDGDDVSGLDRKDEEEVDFLKVYFESNQESEQRERDTTEKSTQQSHESSLSKDAKHSSTSTTQQNNLSNPSSHDRYGHLHSAKNIILPAIQNIQEEHDESYLDDLHRENATLLSTMTQQSSQINDIQKVEQTMMQITTLLNQFTELISEQEEDVIAIHESAKTTKENMNRGTDQIVDATERNKKSGHLMAKFIFGLGVVLWLLNWIFP